VFCRLADLRPPPRDAVEPRAMATAPQRR
jgi:hypothetical protein